VDAMVVLDSNSYGNCGVDQCSLLLEEKKATNFSPFPEDRACQSADPA